MIGALLLVGLGCRPATSCPEDGAACGGDPSAGDVNGITWSVADACRDPFFAQPVPPTYLGQPVQMSRQPTPMMASSDWCSSLVIGSTGVTGFLFPHDTLSPAGGQITYRSDASDPQSTQGSYQAELDTAGSGSVELSHACLMRTAMSLTCAEVATALTVFAAAPPGDPGVPCSDSPSEPARCQFYFSYQGIACADSGDGGCRCTYQVQFAGRFAGRWRRNGGVLTHSDASKMLPSAADYCVGGSGSTLSMWGHDRSDLLDMGGFRTLRLQRTP